jgi:hypothetical protein
MVRGNLSQLQVQYNTIIVLKKTNAFGKDQQMPDVQDMEVKFPLY